MHQAFQRGTAALALAVCGLLTTAHAATVTLDGWAYGSPGSVRATGHVGDAGAFAGALTGAGSFDSDAFVTYCLEITEPFVLGTTVEGYEVVAGSDYLGATKAESLGRLLTYVAAHPQAVDSAAESASMQLAIWNIVYDSDWSVTTAPGFRDFSAHASDANALLGAAQATTSGWNVSVLKKAGSQDLLLARAAGSDLPQVVPAPIDVPEPGSLALAAAALGAGAWVRRRRA